LRWIVKVTPASVTFIYSRVSDARALSKNLQSYAFRDRHAASAFASLLLYIAVALTLRVLVSGEALARYPHLPHLWDVISAAVFANLVLALRF